VVTTGFATLSDLSLVIDQGEFCIRCIYSWCQSICNGNGYKNYLLASGQTTSNSRAVGQLNKSKSMFIVHLQYRHRLYYNGCYCFVLCILHTHLSALMRFYFCCLVDHLSLNVPAVLSLSDYAEGHSDDVSCLGVVILC